MAKKHLIQKHNELDDDLDFDFGHMSSESEAMAGIMSGILEASNNQMMMAIELTKLIVANSSVKNMEEHVFSVFKNATKVIGENVALKKLLEQFGQ